jgi:type IV pilus assembly protein PilP
MAPKLPNRTDMRTRVILLCLLASLVTACSSRQSELEAYVADVKARPAPPLDPLPVMQQFETFEYAAQDLRDPFSKPTDDQSSAAGSGMRPDPDRRKEALESFPLDGLDMMGTLGAGDGLIGLIMDPDRVIHRVVVGNYMGQNDGRIAAVYEDKIELVELVADGAGGWIERRAEVALDDE